MLNSPHGKPLILMFPFGVMSHYLRCLILCRHFSNYFDIRIAYHPAFASFIEQEGVGIFNFEGINSNNAVQAVKQFDFTWMNEVALEQVYLEQVCIIRRFKPFAVLGDQSFTLKMAAETTSVLYISLLNGYMSKYYAGYRKISRTHPVYPFLKKVPSSLQKLLTRYGEAGAFRKLHKPFKEIRRKHELERCQGYLDELEGDITLLCDLEDLFPQNELPSGYQIISPLFYEPHLSVSHIADSIDRTKKTILASMGSTGEWQNLSFLNEPFFCQYNIVATGDASKVLHAPHIVHVPFINIHDVYSFTDLVICHGGNGTIYQALLYQIPMLFKSSHCEQEWNIHAIEEKQLGKIIDEITDTDDYKNIIREWINKKGGQQYQQYSENIKEQILRLPDMIKNIADTVLKNQLAIKGNLTNVSAGTRKKQLFKNV